MTLLKSRINSIDKLIAANLKKRRKGLGISQKELANVANVTIQQIQKYEKGVNRISGGNLFYLAQVLNIPVGYFFDLNDEQEPELWVNGCKMETVCGGSIHIEIKGVQLNNLGGKP